MNVLQSFSITDVSLYASCVAIGYLTLALHSGFQSALGKEPHWVKIMLLCVASAHTALLAQTVWGSHHSGEVALSLGFAQVLSVVTCVGVWLFIIESRWVAIDGLRPLALGFPAIAVLLTVWITPTPVVLHGRAALHVLVAIAAHGVALLACGHAVLLLALSRVLKNGSTAAWALGLAGHCPPLIVLERLLIRLSIWVAALLGATGVLGLLGGLLKLDHKTVLTMLSLLAWLAIPWGYQSRGWRGAKLCTSVMLATGLLILTYIGSRFVLQAVLHR